MGGAARPQGGRRSTSAEALGRSGVFPRLPVKFACLPVEFASFGFGGLAQLGERGVRNAEVEGSNPLPSTT
jgi:hypothetical protein